MMLMVVVVCDVVDELQAGLAQHDDQFRTTLDANKTKVAKDVGVM